MARSVSSSGPIAAKATAKLRQQRLRRKKQAEQQQQQQQRRFSDDDLPSHAVVATAAEQDSDRSTKQKSKQKLNLPQTKSIDARFRPLVLETQRSDESSYHSRDENERRQSAGFRAVGESDESSCYSREDSEVCRITEGSAVFRVVKSEPAVIKQTREQPPPMAKSPSLSPSPIESQPSNGSTLGMLSLLCAAGVELAGNASCLGTNDNDRFRRTLERLGCVPAEEKEDEDVTPSPNAAPRKKRRKDEESLKPDIDDPWRKVGLGAWESDEEGDDTSKRQDDGENHQTKAVENAAAVPLLSSNHKVDVSERPVLKEKPEANVVVKQPSKSTPSKKKPKADTVVDETDDKSSIKLCPSAKDTMKFPEPFKSSRRSSSVARRRSSPRRTKRDRSLSRLSVESLSESSALMTELNSIMNDIQVRENESTTAMDVSDLDEQGFLKTPLAILDDINNTSREEPEDKSVNESVGGSSRDDFVLTKSLSKPYVVFPGPMAEEGPNEAENESTVMSKQGGAESKRSVEPSSAPKLATDSQTNLSDGTTNVREEDDHPVVADDQRSPTTATMLKRSRTPAEDPAKTTEPKRRSSSIPTDDPVPIEPAKTKASSAVAVAKEVPTKPNKTTPGKKMKDQRTPRKRSSPFLQLLRQFQKNEKPQLTKSDIHPSANGSVISAGSATQATKESLDSSESSAATRRRRTKPESPTESLSSTPMSWLAKKRMGWKEKDAPRQRDSSQSPKATVAASRAPAVVTPTEGESAFSIQSSSGTRRTLGTPKPSRDVSFACDNEEADPSNSFSSSSSSSSSVDISSAMMSLDISDSRPRDWTEGRPEDDEDEDNKDWMVFTPGDDDDEPPLCTPKKIKFSFRSSSNDDDNDDDNDNSNQLNVSWAEDLQEDIPDTDDSGIDEPRQLLAALQNDWKSPMRTDYDGDNGDWNPNGFTEWGDPASWTS